MKTNSFKNKMSDLKYDIVFSLTGKSKLILNLSVSTCFCQLTILCLLSSYHWNTSNSAMSYHWRMGRKWLLKSNSRWKFRTESQCFLSCFTHTYTHHTMTIQVLTKVKSTITIVLTHTHKHTHTHTHVNSSPQKHLTIFYPFWFFLWNIHSTMILRKKPVFLCTFRTLAEKYFWPYLKWVLQNLPSLGITQLFQFVFLQYGLKDHFKLQWHHFVLA